MSCVVYNRCLSRGFYTFMLKHVSNYRNYASFEIHTKSNHYEVLGVKRTATQSQIKSAFLKQSHEVHPDKNPDDSEAHEKFVALNVAYSVLSNVSTQTMYNRELDCEHETRRRHPVNINVKPNTATQPHFPPSSFEVIKLKLEDILSKIGFYHCFDGMFDKLAVFVHAVLMSLGVYTLYTERHNISRLTFARERPRKRSFNSD